MGVRRPRAVGLVSGKGQVEQEALDLMLYSGERCLLS